MKVGAKFEKIEDIKGLFPEGYPVVGVGVTAFPRSGLSYILPSYKILSLFETSDLEAIREKCEVVSVGGIRPLNNNKQPGIHRVNNNKQVESKGYSSLGSINRKMGCIPARGAGRRPLKLSKIQKSKGYSPSAAMNKNGVMNLGSEYPEKFNTSGIMRLPEVSKWLLGLGEVGLFLYKASIVTDRILHSQDKSCKRLSTLYSQGQANAIQHSTIGESGETFGLRLLSTPGYIRKVFENKKEFRVEAQKAGLRIPKGVTLLIDEVTDEKWEFCKAEYGERLVFQLTDYTIGGGLGTFFIDTRDDLEKFREFVERRSKDRVLNWVNVTERIEGRQGSVAGCATYYGGVAGPLQNQIMDQPELAALVGRSGVWLGQDWFVRFSKKAQLAAEEQVRKWSEYVYKRGYKGIFGLDVIVTDEDEVVVIECNARYTGAFPVLTMAMLKNGEMPIDVWHLLEWMGVEYEMDIDKVQRVYREPKEGAFVILHNLERKFVTPTKTVRAGVYKVKTLYSQGRLIKGFSTNDIHHSNIGRDSETVKVEYLRPGFSLLDIKDENEFVLCDRVPTEQMVLKPAERLGRLIFGRRIVTDEGELLPWTRGVVKAVYDKFELSVVENPEV